MTLVSLASVVLSFLVLAIAPPVRGTYLLVPVRPGVSSIRFAFDHAIPVVAAGPAGSLVVRGERGALALPVLRAGMVMLAAPAGLCGQEDAA